MLTFKNCAQNALRILKQNSSKLFRCAVVIALITGTASVPLVTQHAQRNKEVPPKVTGIYSRKTADGEVITLSADSPVTRTQSWQDENGFHLVLPNAGDSPVRGNSKGVQVRRIGNSLEIEVAVKPGSTVTVQPGGTRLDLIVSGPLENGKEEEQFAKSQPGSVDPSGQSEPASRNASRPKPNRATPKATATNLDLKQSAELEIATQPIDASTQSQASLKDNPRPRKKGRATARTTRPEVEPRPSQTEEPTITIHASAQSDALQTKSRPRQKRRMAERTSSLAKSSPDQTEEATKPADVSTQSEASSENTPPGQKRAAENASLPKAAAEKSSEQEVQSTDSARMEKHGGKPPVVTNEMALALKAEKHEEPSDVDLPLARPQPALDTSLVASMSSSSLLLVLLGVTLVILLIKRRQKRDFNELGWKSPAAAKQKIDLEAESQARVGDRRRNDRRRNSRTPKTPPSGTANVDPSTLEKNPREQTLEIRDRTLVPAAIYGAYRIDQEVGKLVNGQGHRMEVIASRATDDRRAVEASLLKAITSTEIPEEGKSRARAALENYGFVARQCAALLLAPDAYERASAARVLGDIKSESSLPFLLESLHDNEMIVRTHAISSLGALKMPEAIGALIDMASRHPEEVPASLLSKALTECSLDALDIGHSHSVGRSFSFDENGAFTGEITGLEPTASVEDLPVWMEDESLSEALAKLQSTDVEARAAAAQSLANYQVQRAVEALTALASNDSEPKVRAAAVTSLGAIDHESVFAPTLMAFVDDSREVRAAAARALSRLNFDRADAFVRIIETADEATKRAVASACIKAGMTAQAIDRLASEDRRQAYEAFSLLSLCARAGEYNPILQAIDKHADINVRLSGIRLLGLSGQPEIIDELRQLAVRDGVPQKVRMALMEVVYKIDQAQPA